MIGYKYFECSAFQWRFHHGAIVPLEMPHIDPFLSLKQVRWLLMKKLAAFARWGEDFDQLSDGDWWYVIKDSPEDLSALSKNTRNQIRRGYKRFYVSPLSATEIIEHGYDVYCSAFARYKTSERMLPKDSFIRALRGLPEETEFWGAREHDTGRLVAFSENLVRDGACFYSTMWFEPEALKGYVGYVLIHEMNRHYLNDRGLRYVNDGARNLSHKTRIHAFLEQKFAFRKAYANLRVVYFPGVGLFVSFLYPFRRWFTKGSSAFAKKVAVILEQERIRRSCFNGEVK